MLLAWPSPLLPVRARILVGAAVRRRTYPSSFMEATCTNVNDKLELVRADEHPDWRPRQADIDYAIGVMEVTYVDRFFVVDGKDAEKRLEQRRRKALELITMRLGDWRSDQIVHWCRGGCADRLWALWLSPN